jgi:polyisoprenoid-binding protein YceI
MHISGWKSWTITAGAIAGIAVFLSASAAPPRRQAAQTAAQEVVLSLDPSQSKVHYSVDTTLHTVHGTFALKSGVVRFDPATGKASGEIVVYATSGDSGNSSRDEKMHKVVLESIKFPEVVFKPAQLEGHLALSGASDVKLRGGFSLHGSDHELSVPVHADLAANHWKATAKFAVPFVQWGLKDPSTFLLKVKPNVEVQLDFAGTL